LTGEPSNAQRNTRRYSTTVSFLWGLVAAAAGKEQQAADVKSCVSLSLALLEEAREVVERGEGGG
jgi:hypothetical protein